MKKPNFLLPLGILPLSVLPVTLALAGCNAPVDNTVVINSSSVSSTGSSLSNSASDNSALNGDGNSVISGNGITNHASTSSKAPSQSKKLAAAVTSAEARPMKSSSGKPPAKGPAKPPAKADAKPDPAYHIDEPSSPEQAKVSVPPPPANFEVPANARVKFVTSKGSFVIQLNPKEAPLHSKSFYYLAKRGFYDGTVFHRYEDLTGQGGYIIQGGDPFTRNEETRGMAGGGGPGYTVPREHNKLTHEKLVIAAARTADPDSAGSQFYFTYSPIDFLDTAGGGYTVFGKVVEGGDIVLKLRKDDVIKKAIAE